MKEAFTPVSRLFLDREGILKVVIAEGAELGIEDVRNIFEVEKRMLQGRRGIVLVDARNSYSISSEARSYAIAQRDSRVATAILTTSIAYKVVNDIYYRFYSSPSPVKVFMSEDKAREWLLSFIEVKKAV
jgi:2-polyprenyl-6-methoxyphenol hydroxylase-like FAD-dependent oxidoreductase